MGIPCDYHVHSHHSCDGKASPEAMCEAAVSAGLREVCFTEHVDWIPWDRTRDFFDPGRYLPAVRECRARFAGRLEVRAGLEVSEPHLVAGELRALLESHPVDFVLGSAHWIDRSGVYFSDLYSLHAADHVEREYFLRVLELVETGEFDSLGHLDLVKRYRPRELGPFETERHAEAIRAILRVLVRRDRAFEINTSPLRRGLDAPCPDLTVLRWYRELGGEKVTVGSDAHQPGQVGTGFGTALGMLKSAGFTRIVRYVQRQPEWVAL